ncbi:hypothetical protein CMO90_03265 [Candidatus Woesearchaeota archaeon]|jgi:Ni,Fe-hydrogenase maturation factor|nr:hypothetical protein [Candidatus Woesearchaeota archaeon]|tara:strand:- start:1775 stop:2170 length:396 start_codon:yes stop_codon:yes gene_type:complete
MIVLVFGNPLLECDSLAVELSDELSVELSDENVEFIKCVSPEQILEKKFDYIMDVVEDIDEIKIFDNLKLLNPHRMFSLHDFDVTFFLGLMEKLGKIKRVKIIGIPIGYDKEEAKHELKHELIKLLSTGHS